MICTKWDNYCGHLTFNSTGVIEEILEIKYFKHTLKCFDESSS